MKKRKDCFKVLIIGAMDSELQPLLNFVGKSKTRKLLNIYPLIKTSYKALELYIVKTFVGDVNASVAALEAIREINPKYVIKFGAVGGSFPESKAGDIIIPLGYFHRTSWITRDKNSNKPTSDASKWLSVFGELPYQVNSRNLGNMPYFFSVPKPIQNICIKSLNRLGLSFIKAYVGGGNMWMFGKEVLDNVAMTLIPESSKNKRFISDMESYTIAHVCYLMQIPFIGCYVVANNDYFDEEYNPSFVSNQINLLVPYVLDLAKNLVNYKS